MHKPWCGHQEDIPGAGPECILQRGETVKLDNACLNKVLRPMVQRPKTAQHRQIQETLLKSYKEYHGMGVPRRAGQVSFTYLVVIDYFLRRIVDPSVCGYM